MKLDVDADVDADVHPDERSLAQRFASPHQWRVAQLIAPVPVRTDTFLPLTCA